MENDWVLLRSFGSIASAQMCRGLLEENGIKAVILNEKDSSFLVGDVEVYIAAPERERALELLDDAKIE